MNAAYSRDHWIERLLGERAQARFQGYLDRLSDEEYEAAAVGNDKRANYLHYLQQEAPRHYIEAGQRLAARAAA